MLDQSRRKLLKQAAGGLGAIAVTMFGVKLAAAGSHRAQPPVLLPADENGVSLPAGYRCRIVARSSLPVLDGKPFRWHAAPDGGACFAAEKGGWVYVSNSEMRAGGGASAIVFDADGSIIDAYSILSGTSNNCAGGATPWGSWLSCEEVDNGRVWECDPAGREPAVVRPALGVFKHEAVAVDERSLQLYLTEDEKDGCLYRFTGARLTAAGRPDLNSGVLEVAVSRGKAGADPLLDWVRVPDPLAETQPARYQLPSAMRFNGGEGIACFEQQLIFTTKGDDRVWCYHTGNQQLQILYDKKTSATPVLSGVDNIALSQDGVIYVAEDGGDMQIVVIDQQGAVYPVAQLHGHDRSEVTGLAFSPDGRRLYFSSQRGAGGRSENGITYELQGF